MCADIVPAPIGESIQRHHGIVLAAGAGISIRRVGTVDLDRLEAFRLHVGSSLQHRISTEGCVAWIGEVEQLALRADLAHLRKWRKSVEQAQGLTC